MSEIEWVDVGPDFGSQWVHGACNARVGTGHGAGGLGAGHPITCGWPRRADGTCPQGHPAKPPYVDPMTRLAELLDLCEPGDDAPVTWGVLRRQVRKAAGLPEEDTYDDE
jgi:hypothetical protein